MTIICTTLLLALANGAECPPSLHEMPIVTTWYDYALGGINCDSDCSMMADGSASVDATYYGDDIVSTAACIQEWVGETVMIDGLGIFRCRDTGGDMIIEFNDVYREWVIHLDVLSHSAIGCNYCLWNSWEIE